uniref:Uncharacterized protein n=1 Tax=Acrobeloides nanus TaxID=290746 RepID=A0A914CSU3_9BILA
MVSSLLSERHLPKLPSRNSMTTDKPSYPPVRNRLAEQDNTPMNQTYTIGTPANRQMAPRERSNSVDSEMAEYSIHGAIAGLFPRNLIHAPNHKKDKFSAHSEKKFPSNESRDSPLPHCMLNKLPSLDGLCVDRKCTMRPWTRTQLELQKFKETLKNA